MTTAITPYLVSGEVPSALQPVVGAEQYEPPSPAVGRGIWLKTHIFRDGHFLAARVYMVAATRPVVFEARVDLRPIAKAVLRYHAKLHGGKVAGDCIGCDDAMVGAFPGSFFKAVGRTANKIGKSQLMKQVGRTAKSVVKSKALGAITATAAVVFPPVGAPALAAYTTANAALAVVEKGQATARVALNTAKDLKVSARVKAGAKITLLGPAAERKRKAVLLTQVNRRVAQTTGAQKAKMIKARQAFLARVQAQAKARAAAVPPENLKRARVIIKRGAEAKKRARVIKANQGALKKNVDTAARMRKMFGRISTLARYSQNPAQKAHYQKMAQIFNIVAQSRTQQRDIAARRDPKARKGQTGLVVDNQGRILTGDFVERAATPGAPAGLFMAAKGKVKPGHFTKVGGCVGCI